MITFKINLLQYKAAVMKVKNKAGVPVDCVVIPIDQNDLFRGEKGIYADFVAFEIKEKKGDSKDTHLVKQSFGKEILEGLTEEQRKALPIFGGLRLWDERAEKDSVSSAEVIDEESGLPF